MKWIPAFAGMTTRTPSTGLGADMERPLSSPNIQIIFVFSSFFLMILQGAGCFDDESV